MKLDPNSPAFPFTEMSINNPPVVAEIHYGLTVRQHFAAMALQAFISADPSEEGVVNEVSEDAARLARTSVRYADALVQALNAEAP